MTLFYFSAFRVFIALSYFWAFGVLVFLGSDTIPVN